MSIVVERRGDEVPYGVLTGDTLFIGDVGRPDLLASIGFTREQLAGMLYDSLHSKLMTLPDATGVPAHGAGSACGKNLSTDLWSTIGEQKQTNYALHAADKATFVDLVTQGQPPAPSYFAVDAMLNRQDRALLDETKMPTALNYTEVLDALNGGALLVDGRSPDHFALGHLRRSINIGLDGRYAEFAGSVLPSDVDIVLFSGPGQELEGKNRLARIGFDRVVGYLDRPFEVMFDHRSDVQIAPRLTAKSFDQRRSEFTDVQVVDVQTRRSRGGKHPERRRHPVGQLPDRCEELDPAKPTVVYCRRISLLGSRELVAPARIWRRERHRGRLQRVGSRSTECVDE
ncbi:hypothetical protein MARA_03970 [Mycolicibacterium arabiense]|uniref:Rhodanese domain-containing protein n=1 Tax=Mycolicibacterium arabiense TaxID=1286181 RepID=A0A7I7RSI8_9MYCO|nr:hypothetical protein MARA_03970 [Mycolicibacterium arabiense]